jgi:hypothetical protein
MTLPGLTLGGPLGFYAGFGTAIDLDKGTLTTGNSQGPEQNLIDLQGTSASDTSGPMNFQGGAATIDSSGDVNASGAGAFAGALTSITGPFSTDNNQVNTDGAGDLTCVTLTQTSDENLKHAIGPMIGTNALAIVRALSVSNYTLLPRVFSRTNWTTSVVVSTNTVVISRTNWIIGKPVPMVTQFTNLVVRRVLYRTPSVTLVTNNYPIVHTGPMAQDVALLLGGPTNVYCPSDLLGVMWAATKELDAELQSLRAALTNR